MVRHSYIPSNSPHHPGTPPRPHGPGYPPGYPNPGQRRGNMFSPRAGTDAGSVKPRWPHQYHPRTASPLRQPYGGR